MIKTYTIEVELTDGKNIVRRTNDGFNPYELLGILEHTQLEILAQMAGNIKPDIIKRTLIDD